VYSYRSETEDPIRRTRADAAKGNTKYLFKNTSTLRLTYQIRVLTFQAADAGGQLIIRLPISCRIHSTLREFANQHSKFIKLETIK
jgi:hypothetical protein